MLRSVRTPGSWRALSLLAGLSLAILLAVLAQAPPRPRGLETAATAFSALRARAHLAWIAAEPHPLGSPAHARVRERLVAELSAAGLEVQTQRAEVPIPARAALAWVENVLARLPGTDGHGGAVLVACHYDSVPGSYGAADDGAAMAALLEAVRALQAEGPLKRDLILLITDGEEAGLLGAEAFVQHHPWAREVGVILNLEARGTGGTVQMFETTPGNGGLIRALGRSVPHPSATSLAGDIYRRMPNNTDFSELRRLGKPGLGFAFIGRPWDYHHPTDHPDRLDLGSLQQMGDATLGLVRHFGQGADPSPRGDAVYFNLFGRHFVHYPAGVAPGLGLLALLLAGILILRDHRAARLPFRDLVKALGLLVAGLGAAALLGALLLPAVAWAQGLWSVREPLALRYNTWYLLVPLGLALALLPALARLLGERAPLALGRSALVVWALLAAATGFALTGGSYLFQLPALLALAAALVWPERLRAQVPALLASVLLFAPLLPLLATGLGLGPGIFAGLAVVFLLLAGLAAPFLLHLHLHRLLLPATALLALGSLVTGGAWARSAFEGRVFANVRHVQNLDTGRAWWVAERRHQGPWVDRFLTQPRPGNPSWEGDGRLRPTSESAFLHQAAPMAPGPEPSLTLLEEIRREGLRILRLRVQAEGAEEVWIRWQPERFCQVSAQGHLLRSIPFTRSGGLLRPTAAPEGMARLLAPPRTPIDLELRFADSADPLQIGLQARFPGLPDFPALDLRPPAPVQPIGEGNARWVGRVLTLGGPGPGSPSAPAPDTTRAR